jgi:hypothetical protein
MPRPEVVWLDGTQDVDPAMVGARGATIARLRAAGLPAPRGFVVPASIFAGAGISVSRDEGGMLHLPDELAQLVLAAIHRLGGPIAVRRSPIGEDRHIKGLLHEPFLNIIDGTDALEAVRRLWVPALRSGQPTAVLVQRYVAPDACATVREQDAEHLVVEATYGAGDLLAAGLVVPDRLVVDAASGRVESLQIGRKSQMSIPRADGGLVRVPVPNTSSREPAWPEAAIGELAALWRRAEGALGELRSLSASLAGTQLSITSAIRRH